MSLADDIPVRANGEAVKPSWANVLRTAILNMFGPGAIEETSFTIANNQSSAADVTGLSFDSASYRGAIVEYDLKRGTTSSELRAIGFLYLTYHEEDSQWEISGHEWSGDDHGVTFSVTSAGQVQYTSDNGQAGTLRFRARTFDA